MIANANSANITVLLQTAPGSGQYQAATSYAVGGKPNDVQLADVNGDGDRCDRGGQCFERPRRHPAAGSCESGPFPRGGTRWLRRMRHQASRWGTSTAMEKLDIAAGTSDSNGNNGAVIVFYQETLPARARSPLAPVTVAAGAQPITVKIADMNGDGVPDLVAANFGAGTDGAGLGGIRSPAGSRELPARSSRRSRISRRAERPISS